MSENRDKITILIMAGGTGGHVVPALAVARELTDAGVCVAWLGTRRGLEARLVPAAGFPIHWVHIGALRGTGLVRLLLAPFVLAWAAVESVLIFMRVRPQAVLGMGGFAAGPGGLVAWLMRRPLLIHEQNAIAGLTNRLLAPLAVRVMQGFEGAFPRRRGPTTTGNPVGREIARLSASGTENSAPPSGPARLLVLGGSRGAKVLNEVIPRALARMEPGDRPEIWHQCGDAHADSTTAAYEGSGIRGRVTPFINDMAEAYAWADLVVCRAGALTIAELSAAGRAALFVPYPYAVDDHQTANARGLVDAGGARLISQPLFTPERTAEIISELVRDRERLREMGRRARSLARPDAAAQVARQCLAVLGLSSRQQSKESLS